MPMRRVRTTKKLAQRIDLQYFARPHPLRRWRFLLSLLVPVAALVWFLSQRATGAQKVYSSGPLSTSHAVFTSRCNLCHLVQAGAFFEHVADKECLTCHDAPVHNARQVFTPECGSCHVEHKGALLLARTSEAACTQCHASLRTRTGSPQYASEIPGFDGNRHPEFACRRPGATDPGKVKLNHYAHLQPKLTGPQGPVQMQCSDCHRVSGQEGRWPYALGVEPKPAPPAPSLAAFRTVHGRAHMAPIEYVKQCAGCHVGDLQFDARFNDPVPHDKPEVVHAFLVKRFTDYLAARPSAINEGWIPPKLVAARMPMPIETPPHTPPEWLAYQVNHSERLLWNKGCKLCHTMEYGAGPLPQVAKSNIPQRWMKNAEFSHDAHRMMACTSCHTQAPSSRDTADVLVPGIKVCQQCHREAGAKANAAEGRCFECHNYHQWTNEQPIKGNFTVPQLRSSNDGGARPAHSYAVISWE
jgi:hypothetical protein